MVYLGVRTWQVFVCFVAVVRVRLYYVDAFDFFVLRHCFVTAGSYTEDEPTKWHGKTSEFVTSILVLSVSAGCK